MDRTNHFEQLWPLQRVQTGCSHLVFIGAVNTGARTHQANVLEESRLHPISTLERGSKKQAVALC